MQTEKTPAKDTSGDKGRTALTAVGVAGAIAVNIAAFMLSAAAITAVAEGSGISKTIAWALVLAVDGLMVTGTVVFIANKLRSRSVTYPLTVLAAGVLLSIICNALHAKTGGGHIVKLSDGAKMAVSAIPAVSLALSFHLIADMVKDSLGQPETAAEPVSAGNSADTSKDTPEDTSRDRRKTPGQTPRRPSPKTPVKDTRTKARELLKTNPDMNAGELARRLGKEPSGYIRTLRASILAELKDATDGTADAPANVPAPHLHAVADE